MPRSGNYHRAHPPTHVRGSLFPPQTDLNPRSEGAFQSAANLTLDLIFEPTRASRLVEYQPRQPILAGPLQVVEATLNATWYASRRQGLRGTTPVPPSMTGHFVSYHA